MMMDHHRQISAGEQHKKKKNSTNSNIIIETDETNCINANSISDSNNCNSNSNTNPDSSLLFGVGAGAGATSSTKTASAQSPALLDDEAFDKIEMDFDAIMANDLETPTIPSGSNTNTNNNSNNGSIHSGAGIDIGGMNNSNSNNMNTNNNNNNNMLFDKLFSSPGSQGGSTKMGISSKLGDIGNELNIELNLEDILPSPTETSATGNKNINTTHQHSSSSNDSISIASSFGGGSLMGGGLMGSGTSLGFGASSEHITTNNASFSSSINNKGHDSDSSLDKLFNSIKGGNNSDSSIEKLLMGNSESTFDKLLNMDIIDIGNNDDNDNDSNYINTGAKNLSTHGSYNDSNSNNNNNNNNNSNNNTHVYPTECSSGFAATSIGTATDVNNRINNTGTGTANMPSSNGTVQQDLNPTKVLSSSIASSVDARQQQYSMMMQQQQQQQQQQQMFLQQQQQQQQQHHQHQQHQQQQQDSIRSIVNNQLSQLPQNNQLTQMGVAGLEREKMKLLRRLQEIELSGTQGVGGIGGGVPVQPIHQQNQEQQQFQYQQQLQRQQQSLLQQQQQQQQQQRGMAISAPSSMTMTTPLRTNSAGSFITQHRQRHQQHQQVASDYLSPTPIGSMEPTPIMANSNLNINSNSHSNMTMNSSNSNSNSNSNNMTSNNMSISSVMVAGRKETPLQSFLRNKRGPAANNSQHEQHPNSTTTMNNMGAATSIDIRNKSSSKSSMLDATPLDFSSTSTNPFLRRQMMSNIDRSVNRNNSIRGRLGGRVSGSALSSSARQSMMLQMSSGNNLSSSMHTPSSLSSTTPIRGNVIRRNSSYVTGRDGADISSSNMPGRGSSDFYQSAGILSRHASEDHIVVPSRRTSIGAGAAKAQNRRFTLSRSNSSFGNLTKNSKHGSGRELHKGGSQRSLGSNDSSGSLIPTKRGGGRGSSSGAKYKLGGGKRSNSVPYMIPGKNDPNNSPDGSAHQGSRQNDGWP